MEYYVVLVLKLEDLSASSVVSDLRGSLPLRGTWGPTVLTTMTTPFSLKTKNSTISSKCLKFRFDHSKIIKHKLRETPQLLTCSSHTHFTVVSFRGLQERWSDLRGSWHTLCHVLRAGSDVYTPPSPPLRPLRQNQPESDWANKHDFQPVMWLYDPSRDQMCAPLTSSQVVLFHRSVILCCFYSFTEHLTQANSMYKYRYGVCLSSIIKWIYKKKKN